jgi:ornithine carrier protein
MAGKLVEHPFDTIKVRLQTQSLLRTGPASSSAPGAKVFSGPWECLRKTVSKEGWLGLYQVSFPLCIVTQCKYVYSTHHVQYTLQ